MNQFLISLDELDRVKKMNGLRNTSDIARHTGMGRATWTRAVNTRRATPDVLNALAQLGARPDKVLVLADTRELVNQQSLVKQ